MNDLGLMHYYLGLEIWKNPNEIFLRQGKLHSEGPLEVWDDGLQIHAYSHGNKFEEVERL
jgi:hypothetical protein